MFQVIRGEDRPRSTMPGVTSAHTFSFGDHYDPANTHHGLLTVCNDETVSAGTGFDSHPHRAVEIVTWVHRGALVHQDNAGHRGIVYPGLAQRMSAGTGIVHSERNDAPEPADAAVRFVQMWILPDTPSAAPSYEQNEVDAELAGGSLIPIASGDPGHDAAIRIGARSATLFAARIAPNGSVELPEARFGFLYLVDGSAAATELGPEHLITGDSVRSTDAGTALTAGAAGAEVLYWAMSAGLGDR